MRLVLIDAGGTISAVDRGQGFEGGQLGPDSLAYLTDAVPDLCVEMRSVYRGLSEAMAFSDAMAVVRAVRDASRTPGVDAVVVAHGTDAMEETAFLCELAAEPACPVVFTGAQRTPSDEGYDGVKNLLAAIAAAREPDPTSRVRIAFGGRVLAASRARKVHAQDLVAFGPESAVAGAADARLLPQLDCRKPAADVEIVTLGLASNGRMVRAAVSGEAQGVVLQGLGCGNASDDVVEAVRESVAAGRLVGVVSGCFEGTAMPLYESGRRLAGAGAIFMGDLDPRRARLVLACALGDDREPADAARLVQAWLDAR